MPVKSGENGKAVLQPHIEFVALVQGETERPGRLRHAVALRGLAGDLDLPRLHA